MDDLLPRNPPVDPSPAPAADTQPARKSRKITCEFCESVLTADGEYLSLGDKAKTFRKADEQIDALRTEVTRLETDNRTLRAELDALKVAAPKRASNDW